MAVTKPKPTDFTNPYMFRVYRNGNVVLNSSPQSDTIVFNAEIFDPNSNFNTTNGVYTAPVAGYYLFIGHARVDSTGATYLQLGIGEKIDDRSCVNGNQVNLNGSVFKHLNAGDTISCWVYHSGGTSNLIGDSIEATTFMGVLLYAD